MRARTAVLGGLAAAIVLAVAIGLRSSESGPQAWEPPRGIKAEGAGSCFNYLRSFPVWMSTARPGHPAGMLVRDRDLLVLGKEERRDKEGGRTDGAFTYRSSDGATLAFQVEESALSLAGQAVSLKLPKDAKAWEWLEKADRDALARIRFVDLDKDLDADRLPLLRKLAEANPRVGLVINDLETAKQVLPLFRPTQLVGASFLFKEGAAALLPRLQDIELLAVSVDQEKGLAFLDALPKLQALLLFDWDPLATGPLPVGCERLRSMFIMGAKIDDLVAIAHLTQLEELGLAGCKNLADIGALGGFASLKALSLANCEKVEDVSPLKKLPGLVCLSLPPKISQEQFAAAVRDHPRLQVLELLGAEKIADLSPLLELRELKALVLVHVPLEALEPLLQLKGLQFLALDKDYFEKEPEAVAKLEKALSGCLVVQAEPACLGSGWILLLVPAAGAAWLVARRRRRLALHA